ncbi:MAG: hypothetical protein CMJ68_12460 [Planctomycetaceae bacterium]|jgi:hypothetical protein|nr:hypothetical protein [Planctomycetaceae bacterium]|tara:strand:- start:1940 stop:2599 length:660 start_codon:yes stop_codon:yes gene_type:complete
MDAMEPLNFVTVKCQFCGTFYRLAPGKMEEGRTCPKCHETQRGSLSIVGAPLSRAALASSMRVLLIRSGRYKGKKLLLPNEEVVIGRAKSCQIRDKSEELAEEHCALQPTPEGLRVQDLDTEQGTFVNRERIDEPVFMRPGDLLRVGPLLYQLAGHDMPEDNEPAASLKLSTGVQTKQVDKDTVLFKSKKNTAAEAAEVIQEHWELTRSRPAVPEWIDE